MAPCIRRQIDVWSSGHLRQGVLLITCNRMEAYTLAATAEEGLARLHRALFERWEGDPAGIQPYLDVYVGEDMVRHVFRLAAGLESQVLGEAEVLGQLSTAVQRATVSKAARGPLLRLFHHALRTGRRARSETAIGRHACSVSSVAVRLATRTLGGVGGRRVLVVGAGIAAALAARAFARMGADVMVANRTAARAQHLAEAIEGRAVPWSALTDGFGGAEMIVTATSSPDYLIGVDEVRAALEARRVERLLVLDISVPRNVDPAVAGVPGVTLQNVDDLKSVLGAGLEARRGAVAAVEAIIEEEMERYRAWWAALAVVPTLRDLYQRAEELRQRELAKTLRKLPGLSDDQRAAVEALSQSLVRKMLHDPVLALKKDTTNADTLAAARLLFHLPPEGAEGS